MKNVLLAFLLAMGYVVFAFVVAGVLGHFGIIKGDVEEYGWRTLVCILLYDYCKRLIDDTH